MLTTNYDYDYKTYNTGKPTYFDTPELLTECQVKYYDKGLGGSAGADAINGCAERYYSDHAFIWAVFDS